MTSASPDSCFAAASYADARAGFLAACAAAGARVESQRHPLAGPGGEELFLDEARLGSDDARRVLFVASGTHGIEGFCGSGVQRFLLGRGIGERLPQDLALVLVHAVNPWGFAWLRRVNEDNVDVNRNFLDHAGPHPENPDYDALYALLHPERLDEASIAACLEAMGRLGRERGQTAVYRALSGGQYRHPRGVQFGGTEAVWSNRALRSAWARHAAGAELAVHVDLHSGLGPRGVGLLLQTAAADSLEARLSHAWWPDLVRSEPAEGEDAALVTGLIGPAFRAAHPGRAAVGVVLEFGTVAPDQVILAVQADHWLDRCGDRGSEEGRAIQKRMRDAFFVDEPDWKEKVCARAGEVMERTLAGMGAFEPDASS